MDTDHLKSVQKMDLICGKKTISLLFILRLVINMGKNNHTEKWTLSDESMYIDHVVKDHGKGQIDASVILDSWLQHYRTRVWDFDGASVLKRKVMDALDCLRAAGA